MQMKMEEGFAQINKDLNEVKEKIKKLEDQQTPTNKMDKRSFVSKTTFKGLHNSSFSKYIPTVKASEEFFEEREKEKQAQKEKLNQTSSENDKSQDKSSSITKTQENKSKHDNKRQRMYNTSDSSDSGDNSRTNNSSKKIIHSVLKDNKGKQVSFDTPSNTEKEGHTISNEIQQLREENNNLQCKLQKMYEDISQQFTTIYTIIMKPGELAQHSDQ